MLLPAECVCGCQVSKKRNNTHTAVCTGRPNIVASSRKITWKQGPVRGPFHFLWGQLGLLGTHPILRISSTAKQYDPFPTLNMHACNKFVAFKTHVVDHFFGKTTGFPHFWYVYPRVIHINKKMWDIVGLDGVVPVLSSHLSGLAWFVVFHIFLFAMHH